MDHCFNITEVQRCNDDAQECVATPGIRHRIQEAARAAIGLLRRPRPSGGGPRSTGWATNWTWMARDATTPQPGREPRTALGTAVLMEVAGTPSSTTTEETTGGSQGSPPPHPHGAGNGGGVLRLCFLRPRYQRLAEGTGASDPGLQRPVLLQRRDSRSIGGRLRSTLAPLPLLCGRRTGTACPPTPISRWRGPSGTLRPLEDADPDEDGNHLARW